MTSRYLGRTGVLVSPLTLGAMNFGAWANRDHEDAIRIIHRALDAGITVVDTADVYSQGENEQIVGKALAGRRDEVFLATKFHGQIGTDPNTRGNSRRWILRAVEDSLRRLGTDHLDLYQIHRPDPDVPLEETLGALDDLVSAGKIRYYGTTTFEPISWWRRNGSPRIGACTGRSVNNRRIPSWRAGPNEPPCRLPSATGWGC